MKLNIKPLPAAGALLVISAVANEAGANPLPTPPDISTSASTLTVSLNSSTLEPLWSYPLGFVPQGAIAQRRPVIHNGRVQIPSWSPLAIRPQDTNLIATTNAPQADASPLASLLPTEQVQSTIAISNRAGAAKIKPVKSRVEPGLSMPTKPATPEAAAFRPVPTKSVVAKQVVAKSNAAGVVDTPESLRIATRPLVTATEMAPTASTPAVGAPTATIPTPTIASTVAAPVKPAQAAVKTPAARTVATPTPLASRHKDLTRLAQLEADLNRTDKRLKSAEAKLTQGQQQLNKWGDKLREAMMEAGPDARGLHPFVRVAQRYAGTPYLWGGESKNGFDCSGFIIVVMRDLGYKTLPHSAAEQFKYGKPIARNLMKPGDLVFFKGTYKPGISHVGIYLGKNRFIHAAGTGKGTIVSSLSEAKWRPGGPHYAGARRLIAARKS